MLRYFPLYIFVLIIVGLSGCQPIKRDEYSYILPELKADKFCALRCISAKSSCEKICRMKHPRCFMSKIQDHTYQFQQEALRHQKITKTIKELVYPASCLNVCHCTSSFNTCYLACGGQVIKHLHKK